MKRVTFKCWPIETSIQMEKREGPLMTYQIVVDMPTIPHTTPQLKNRLKEIIHDLHGKILIEVEILDIRDHNEIYQRDLLNETEMKCGKWTYNTHTDQFIYVTRRDGV